MSTRPSAIVSLKDPAVRRKESRFQPVYLRTFGAIFLFFLKENEIVIHIAPALLRSCNLQLYKNNNKKK